MSLNTFLLFDGALMLVGLPKLMIWKGKKSNGDFTLQKAKDNAFSNTQSWFSK